MKVLIADNPNYTCNYFRAHLKANHYPDDITYSVDYTFVFMFLPDDSTTGYFATVHFAHFTSMWSGFGLVFGPFLDCGKV